MVAWGVCFQRQPLRWPYLGKIMDGEAVFVVSDIGTVMGSMRFATMISMVTWVESVE